MEFNPVTDYLILGYEYFHKNILDKYMLIKNPNVFSRKEIENFQYIIDIKKYNTTAFRVNIFNHNHDNFIIRKSLFEINNEKYCFPIHIDKQAFWASKYKKKTLKIPSKVIDDIKLKQCKIGFFMPAEGQGFKMDQRIDLLKNQAKYLNLNLNDIFYLDSNIKTPEVLKEQELFGIYYNFWEAYNSLPKIEVKKIIKKIKQGAPRDKKFLCFNRQPRAHRIELVKRLIDSKLIDNMILSCGRLGIFYDVTDLITNNPTGLNLNAQLSTYINIVTETYYSHDETRMFFSEKIFKPISCLQPFILVGQPDSLKFLREFGYKTFDGWINEEYDSIQNNRGRMDAIISEIKRLDSLSTDELSNLMYEMLPTLIHNYKTHRQRCANPIKELPIVHSINSFIAK